MIAILKGEIIAKEEQALIVQIGGVGLKVITTLQTCAQNVIGENVFLYTHLLPREDSLTLYGFESAEEREMFKQIISVSGIGPRIALAILSTLSLRDIYRAVLSEQPSHFDQVTGVGRKTSQKLIIYLKDKLSPYAEKIGAGIENDTDSEVIAALMNLGYSMQEAQTALKTVAKDTADDVETKLRMALQYFSS